MFSALKHRAWPKIGVCGERRVRPGLGYVFSFCLCFPRLLPRHGYREWCRGPEGSAASFASRLSSLRSDHNFAAGLKHFFSRGGGRGVGRSGVSWSLL